jgi:uncharacterized membrane protein
VRAHRYTVHFFLPAIFLWYVHYIVHTLHNSIYTVYTAWSKKKMLYDTLIFSGIAHSLRWYCIIALKKGSKICMFGLRNWKRV